MSLLQMSFSGAVLILAILVVRAVAINKLPKRIFLILWGTALLRLLLPFSIPSAFSVYSLWQGKGNTGKALGGALAADLIPVAREGRLIMADGEMLYGVQSGGSFSVRFLVWVLGALCCAVFFAVSYLRCYREFRMSLPVENAFTAQWLKEHKRKRSIEIRQSGIIMAPLTYGIFKPVILLPKNTDWENRQQLGFVLAHEYIHICHFDGALKLILIFAVCVHWFNPMVWIMYVLFNRDIELACDEGVVRWFGEDSRSAYARTLINMEEKNSRLSPLCNNFSKNAIEERIVSVMKTKKATLVAILIGIIVIVGVIIAFATSAEERKQMVFVMDKLYVATGEDVSKEVIANIEASEIDSPYIGEITSTVGAYKQPSEEQQSNFGHVGAEMVFSRSGIAVDIDGRWMQFDRADYASFAAMLEEIDGNTVVLDIVEFITDDDTERIRELKLTEEDMPDGYYIYNPDKKTTSFKLSEHTVYRFIDWNRDFVDSDDFDELNILTTDKAVFEKYIDTYDPKPGMPFFFEVQEGYVTKIVEKPIM